MDEVDKAVSTCVIKHGRRTAKAWQPQQHPERTIILDSQSIMSLLDISELQGPRVPTVMCNKPKKVPF